MTDPMRLEGSGRFGGALGPARLFVDFVRQSLAVVLRGGAAYYAWVLLLLAVFANGVAAYSQQVTHGLIVTGMRDQLSWGFYIGNFAYLVGVAAAAVVLVIPAYVYEWKPIKEVVLFGELMAVAAIVMCMLFVNVDIGRPERVWHLMPFVGRPNFPYSMLTWDILVLSSYFAVNYFVASYLVYKGYTGQPYSPGFVLPIIFLSIPLAIGIHTVTAFLFMGLQARAYWHTAILAPRFIASAFCSGPALMVLVFQVLRRSYGLPIGEAALQKIGELLAYAMAINLFFIGAEVFTDFYARTAHSVHADLQWFGAHGLADLPVYTWLALGCDVAAFAIFLVPSLRRRLPVLSVGCVLAAGGIYVEKGLGLLIPGMAPDMLGEFYAYRPSVVEISVGAGIWAFGALLFTWMSKVAAAVVLGTMRRPGVAAIGAGLQAPGPVGAHGGWR
jgi:molybdopterin-containing oxidoreductase family membrane subunit